MKKKYLLTIILFLMLIQNMVCAEQQNDVQVFLNSNSYQFKKQFSIEVNVEFLNKELYNSQVYLSYHVYDKNNKELLWEGRRTPLIIDKLGQNFHGTVNVDLTSISNSKDLKYAVIKIDLVDEKNVYWFSENNKLNMESQNIVYQKDLFQKMTASLKLAFTEAKSIFIVNLIVFVIFWAVYYWIKKKEYFYN